MPGKLIKTTRWQQSYGHNYRYPGQSNTALPIPDLLIPYRDWVQADIDARLKGLLLNWYDGKLGHYIGKHRNITTGLIVGSPIVTISLGEERVFRLRPWRGQGWTDLPMMNGSVVIMPWATNSAWTHEVPRRTRWEGRRISVTVPAFGKQPEDGTGPFSGPPFPARLMATDQQRTDCQRPRVVLLRLDWPKD